MPTSTENRLTRVGHSASAAQSGAPFLYSHGMTSNDSAVTPRASRASLSRHWTRRHVETLELLRTSKRSSYSGGWQ
jgi:hypothetical protein